MRVSIYHVQWIARVQVHSAVIDNFTACTCLLQAQESARQAAHIAACSNMQVVPTLSTARCDVNVAVFASSFLLHLSKQCQHAAGVNLLNESNLIAGILLNTMFLLGTFTFAVVLGVVSDDISSEVKVLDHYASRIHATSCSHFWRCAHCCLLSCSGCTHSCVISSHS